MLRDIIERFNNDSDETPFEVGRAYYNSDVGDRFVVEQIEPEFRLTYSKTSQTLFYDHDIYKWKYKEDIITEVADDTD